MNLSLFSGIVDNVFVPIVFWIALPGYVGGTVMKKFDQGMLGFQLGAGIGILLLITIGPYSGFFSKLNF